ncbi:hypothetical protein KBC99_02890 [Candidatus Saccharibacteria bacterium]|nr:hypothetical protein [Candidatus Saccharibacteria bacterium]
MNEILSRKVSRLEFLQLIGLAVITLVGIRGVINNLDSAMRPKQSSSSQGYGGTPYGR